MTGAAFAACAALCLAGGARAADPPEAPAVTWPQPDVDYMLANVQFTLAHELGHMLIEELGIPVLGGIEYAADQLAAMGFLEGLPGHPHDKAERRRYGRLLGAVAAEWRIGWALSRIEGEEIAYWDVHPLDIQRFYNIACFIYGSDPDYYDDFVESAGLPPERALACEKRHPGALRAAMWVSDTYGAGDADSGGRLRLEYEPGRGMERRSIEALLRRTRALEEIVELTRPLFRLPRDVTVVAVNCLGRPDAMWREDLGEVVICYELMLEFLQHAALYRCAREHPDDRAGDDAAFTRAVAACRQARAATASVEAGRP